MSTHLAPKTPSCVGTWYQTSNCAFCVVLLIPMVVTISLLQPSICTSTLHYQVANWPLPFGQMCEFMCQVPRGRDMDLSLMEAVGELENSESLDEWDARLLSFRTWVQQQPQISIAIVAHGVCPCSIRDPPHVPLHHSPLNIFAPGLAAGGTSMSSELVSQKVTWCSA